jgi:hypothetical protein
MDDIRDVPPKAAYKIYGPDAGGPGDAGPKEKHRYQLILPGDLQIQPGPECLVAGIMGTWELAIIHSGPNGGKTALVSHMALCIAAGMPFAGREVLQGPTVYCVGEGNRGFRKRVKALFQRAGIDQDNRTPFYVLDEVPDLCQKANADRLIDDIKTQLKSPPRLIVIDTLSKAMPHGDDGKGEHMKPLLDHCRHIANVFRCVVLILHHPGWADKTRIRGWSGATGDVETEIKIEGERRGTRTATITKSRDLECVGETMQFDITAEKVRANGEVLNAAAVEVIGEWGITSSSGSDKSVRLSAGQQIALNALVKAIGEAGEVPPACNHIPPRKATVSEGLWRRYHYEMLAEGTTATKNKAHNRAMKELQAKQRIGVWNEQAWIIS